MPSSKKKKRDKMAIRTASLNSKNLLEYFKLRSKTELKNFYNFPIVCFAVYRALPDIARQFVIRILFIDQPIPQAAVKLWCPLEYINESETSIKLLVDLKIWREAKIAGGQLAWEFYPTYKKNLKIALVGGSDVPVLITPCLNNDPKPRDIPFLDNYAISRWKCILHYLVGADSNQSSEGEGISPDAVKVILHANLMKKNERDGVFRITKEGFQFLLLDTRLQVWHFMLQYLDTCKERDLNLIECLSMLLKISFCTLGKDYSSQGMNPKMLTFLQHLREFGLVYQRKRTDGRFYPTRLAIHFANKSEIIPTVKSQEIESHEKGYLIVETNFRVYAYTDSFLHTALLALFTNLLYRFPNLIVAVLTRDSVQQAFRAGITGDQILTYLDQHAHENMKNSKPINYSKYCLPLTIIDQIKLWELEKNRCTFTEGVLYNQFLSQTDFCAVRDYAKSNDFLIWQNERTRLLVVSNNSHHDMKKFWKKFKKENGR